MERTKLEYIQSKIGYVFKKSALLEQAFTRKSYTEENKDVPNNEVLEFYGDKALEFIVMKKMSFYYGQISEKDAFQSSYNEGDLHGIKIKLICRETLAKRIRAMDIQKNLLVGKGDFEQKIWEQESVQEDLFEAIIGAVAIDSEWNVDILTKVVEQMLNPDSYLKKDVNYIELIQQWSHTKYHMPPLYSFICDERTDEVKNMSKGVNCFLSISPFSSFLAWGENKNHAKMAAAKKAYEYLEKKNLLCSLTDIIGKPNLDRAVNQLQELYQKGYITEPRYTFKESHDESGNSVWYCNCHVIDINYPDIGDAYHSSKKQAKKLAAYRLLAFFLAEDDHEA